MKLLRKLRLVGSSLDKELVMVFSDKYDGTLMTQEAYDVVKSKMCRGDLDAHWMLWISPESAVYVDSMCLTEEDVILWG